MRRLTAVIGSAVVLSLTVMAGGVSPVAASTTHITSVRPLTANGEALVQTALALIGAQYSATGATPATGFSSAGFVDYVYSLQHVQLPTTYKEMLASGPRVKRKALEPGDLVFFKDTVWPGLSHVGIYVGAGTFIHAEYFQTGVRVTALKGDPRDGNYWAAHFKAACRPQTGS